MFQKKFRKGIVNVGKYIRIVEKRHDMQTACQIECREGCGEQNGKSSDKNTAKGVSGTNERGGN